MTHPSDAPNCPPASWYAWLANASFEGFEDTPTCTFCDEPLEAADWEAWREEALRDPEPNAPMHRGRCLT